MSPLPARHASFRGRNRVPPRKDAIVFIQEFGLFVQYFDHAAVKRWNPAGTCHLAPFAEAVVNQDGSGIRNVLGLGFPLGQVHDVVKKSGQSISRQRLVEVLSMARNQPDGLTLIDALKDELDDTDVDLVIQQKCIIQINIEEVKTYLVPISL